MRQYEIVMRSGAKNEVTAEVIHDDPGADDKIYFYLDKSQKQLAAYFLRDEVAGNHPRSRQRQRRSPLSFALRVPPCASRPLGDVKVYSVRADMELGAAVSSVRIRLSPN